MTVAQLIVAIIWNNVAYWIYKSIFPPRKMLLIHGDRPIEGILAKFSGRKDKYDIVKCMHIAEGEEALHKEILTGYEGGAYQAVVIWDIATEKRNMLLKFCYANSIRFYIMPKITDVIIASVVPDVMHSLTNSVLKYFDCKPMIVGAGT